MSDEMQALCFVAGANSIFYGDTLLTTPNPDENKDLELFERLGINASGRLVEDASETAAA
jgi:biotin synthase